MKKFMMVLALLTTGSVFAAPDATFPNVYNYGSQVQVQVWNHDNRQVNCNGTLWMRTQSGKSYSEYYSDWVFPRGSSYRTFYARDMNDRIASVSHNIACF